MIVYGGVLWISNSILSATIDETTSAGNKLLPNLFFLSL